MLYGIVAACAAKPHSSCPHRHDITQQEAEVAGASVKIAAVVPKAKPAAKKKNTGADSCAVATKATPVAKAKKVGVKFKAWVRCDGVTWLRRERPSWLRGSAAC